MSSFKCEYIPYVDKFTNSHEFSFLANYFKNNDNKYTTLIPDTLEYIKFWKQVEKWCTEGYTNSTGITVTGKHFFYLNFCRILSETEEKGKKKKIEQFPSFVDLDYDFFWLVEYCELNQKSLIAVKGRRQGWSYKAGGIAAHEFLFNRDSKTIIGGYLSKYSENTMKFALSNLNWINEHTEFRKQRNPDLKEFIKARYQIDIGDGVKVWKGLMSEVHSITFQNNPTAAVGLSANKLIFDEAGVFDNITETYGYTEPLIKNGSNYTGIALLFGSAGDMDSGSKYFYEMFIKPGLYNMLEFEDPDNVDNKIGFFSSSTRGRWGFCRDNKSKWYNTLMVDKDGNSNEEAAYDDLIWEREHKKKTTADASNILLQITQFPVNWKEAFMRSKGTIFASNELLDHLSSLETSKTLSGEKKLIDLYFDAENKLCSKLAPESREIIEFPIPKSYDGDKSGAIVIYEEPEEVNGEIPNYLYLIGCLPPGEKVLTNEGLVNVENVNLDHKLINKEGELVEIYNLQTYNIDNSNLYKIKVTNTFRTTSFTEEHPIYTSKAFYNSDYTINEDKFNFDFNKVKDININDWIKVPNLYNKEIDSNIILSKWLNTSRIDRQIKNPLLNKDFWWFVGLWLGDGWCESDNYNISIVLNSKEHLYIERLKNIITNLFNRSFSIREKSNCLEIKFCYQELSSFLYNNFGKYAKGKRISEWVKYLPKDLKIQLLLGYLDSDGSIIENKYNKYSTEFVSINLELLESFQDILFSLNIISNISKLRDKSERVINNKLCNTQETYHLRLNHNNSLRYYNLYSKEDIQNNHKLLRIKNTKKVRFSKGGCFVSKDGNYIYFKITSIEKSKYTGIVYNYECETHNYLCHHITTHNCDPIDQDDAESSSSLGSCIVYKRFYQADKTSNIIVAEYTGRPNKADDFYEICRKIAIYYNAKILYENQLTGLKAYFQNKISLHLLYEQPQIIKDIVKDSKVNRGYGIHMSKEIKFQCEIYLKQWLYEEKTEINGKKILNLHTIKNIGLLKELVSYDREINTDRVVAFFLCILQTKELYNIQLKLEDNSISDNFLSRLWTQRNIKKNKRWI